MAEPQSKDVAAGSVGAVLIGTGVGGFRRASVAAPTATGAGGAGGTGRTAGLGAPALCSSARASAVFGGPRWRLQRRRARAARAARGGHSSTERSPSPKARTTLGAHEQLHQRVSRPQPADREGCHHCHSSTERSPSPKARTTLGAHEQLHQRVSRPQPAVWPTGRRRGVLAGPGRSDGNGGRPVPAGVVRCQAGAGGAGGYGQPDGAGGFWRGRGGRTATAGGRYRPGLFGVRLRNHAGQTTAAALMLKVDDPTSSWMPLAQVVNPPTAGKLVAT